MFFKFIKLNAIILFVQFTTFGQTPQLGPVYTLNHGLLNCNEPAVVISKANPNKVLIATNTKHLFWSDDDGKTTQHREAQSDLGVYGDPVLVRNEANDFFYIHLAKAANKAWPDCFDRIVVQKSPNEGLTFSNGVGVGFSGKMEDKPWASFDQHQQSPFYQRMYLSWTRFDKYQSKQPGDSSYIMLSYGDGQGENFSEAIRISDRGGNCLDDNGTVEGATTTSLPDGRVLCVWAGHGHLYMDISPDGGKTWGHDRVIDSLPGGWNLTIPGFPRNNALPFIVSNQEGHIWVVSASNVHQKPRVVIYESDDAGGEWQKHYLNADTNESHMMPMLFHDRLSGRTGIVYYKVKPQGTEAVFAWQDANSPVWKTITLSESPFPPPNKNTFFGDYNGLDMVGNIAQAVWTETTPKGTKVCTRRIHFPELNR